MGNSFSEKSRVTIGLALGFVSLAFWVGLAWGQLADVKQKITVLDEMNQRLARIEGKLDRATE